MGPKPVHSTDHDRMAAAIQAQRRQLFKASAVIHVCRYPPASKLEGFDPESLADALQLVDELIDGVSEVLEGFSRDAAIPEHCGDGTSAQVIAESLRTDAAILRHQHPHLHTVHAQLLRAAAMIESLASAPSD